MVGSPTALSQHFVGQLRKASKIEDVMVIQWSMSRFVAFGENLLAVNFAMRKKFKPRHPGCGEFRRSLETLRNIDRSISYTIKKLLPAVAAFGGAQVNAAAANRR